VDRYVKHRDDVKLHIIDTAPRWRAIDDLSIWKRAVGGALQLIRDYAHFLGVMRSSRPDLIHMTTSGHLATLRDIIILFTARCLRIPSVYHIHFGRAQQIAQQHSLEWRALATAMRLANAVIAIDPATALTIKQQLPQVAAFRIPNGLCLDELHPGGPSSKPRTVLFLGWVIPTKGVEELVRAWAKLKMPGWRCIIAGPGSPQYRDKLLQDFKPEALEFLPQQLHDDAINLMKECDVFVLPSHTEGFPYVIIEAMALGKPIIATNVGAIAEILDDGCGVVIEPKDVEALCSALHQVLANELLQAEMAAKAQRKARAEYSMEKVMDELVGLWRGVLQRSCRQEESVC
jgi:glycosyltransferase involved in cell wall biosynthesis